jgi:hypothetical protein
MNRTADDIEADVSRLAGKVTPAPPPTRTGATGETVDNAALFPIDRGRR